jgi:hypothetical protein
MNRYHNSTLQEIIIDLVQRVALCKPKEILSFEVVNPDIASYTNNGERVEISEKEYVYRGYKTWLDLAHLLGCRVLTPLLKDENFIILRYEKLQADASFHLQDVPKESASCLFHTTLSTRLAEWLTWETSGQNVTRGYLHHLIVSVDRDVP